MGSGCGGEKAEVKIYTYNGLAPIESVRKRQDSDLNEFVCSAIVAITSTSQDGTENKCNDSIQSW